MLQFSRRTSQFAVGEYERYLHGLEGVSIDPERIIKGYFIEPTVFGQVKDDMLIWHEEIFRLVVVLYEFGDEEEAIRSASDT